MSPLPMVSALPWIGQGYVLQGCQEEGSEGLVYSGRAPEDAAGAGPSRVSIRILPELTPDDRSCERTRRWRGACSLLMDKERLPEHPNVSRILASFYEDPSRFAHSEPGVSSLFDRSGGLLNSSQKCLFVVTEPLSTSLGAVAAQRRSGAQEGGSSFSDAELLVVMEQVANALQHLQLHRIVHRDVTPANIFVTEPFASGVPGQVKLAGFGKHWDADVQQSFASSVARFESLLAQCGGSLARTSSPCCSDLPLTLAPEVVSAVNAGTDVDFFANDVWALGYSVYRAASGPERAPFPGAVWDLDRFVDTNYQDLERTYGPGLRRLVRALLEPTQLMRAAVSEVAPRAREARRQAGGLHPLAVMDRDVAGEDMCRTLPPLVALLSTGTAGEKASAARVLKMYATGASAGGRGSAQEADSASLSQLLSSGALPHLVAALQLEGDAGHAAGEALVALSAAGAHAHFAIAEVGATAVLSPLLSAGTGDPRRQAALQILANISRDDRTHTAILESGAASPLVALLSDDGPACQEGAAEALRNLAASAAARPALLAAGATAPLLRLLSEGSRVAQARAAAALGRLAGDSMDCRAALGVPSLPPLVALLTGGNSAAEGEAALLLWQLAADDAGVASAAIRAGAVAPLVRLLATGSHSAQLSAARALRALTGNVEAEGQVAVVQAGAVPAVVALLEMGSAAAKEEAAGVLLNLAALDWNHDALVDAGAVAALSRLLRGGPAAAEVAAAALQRLAAGPARATTAGKREAEVLEAGAVPQLVKLVRGSLTPASVSAAGALANLARDSAEARSAIAGAGGILPLVVMLNRRTNQTAQQYAATALQYVAFDAQARHAIMAAGGVIPLVTLLREGSPAAQNAACGALRNLSAGASSEAALRVSIVEADGIPALVDMLRVGSGACQEQAAGALRNLAAAPGTGQAIAGAGAIPLLVELLMAVNRVTQANAAGALANLAACGEAVLSAITEAGAIGPLVMLLRMGNAAAQDRAAAALWGVARGGTANQTAIEEAGGIEALVALLSRGTRLAQERAAAALRSLATDIPRLRAAIAAAGGLAPLVALLSAETTGAQEQAAAALWNLAYDAKNRDAIAEAGAITPLVVLLAAGSPAGQEYAAAALWNLTFGSPRNDMYAVAAGAVPALTKLLAAPGENARAYAAGALANLVSENVQAKAAAVEAGAVPLLEAMLGEGSPDAKERANAVLQALRA